MKDNIFDNCALGVLTLGIVGESKETKLKDKLPYGHDNLISAVKCEFRRFGKTTTLDVKNRLRIWGFIAEQHTVSYDMKELCDEQEIDIYIEQGSIFRVYYPSIDHDDLSIPVVVVDDNNSNTTLDNISSSTDLIDELEINDPKNNMDNPQKYIRRSGQIMNAYSTGTMGYWKCGSEQNNTISLYFEPTWTRDQVRAAYASLNKISGNQVQASRVK